MDVMDGVSDANPLSSAAQDQPEVKATLTETVADVEAVLAGMRDGSVSDAQAAAVMASCFAQAEATEARLAALEAKLTTPGLQNLVRSVYAQLTESPTNWHQAVVFFLASTDPQDTTMHRRSPLMFVASIIMVLVQSTTAIGVFVGAVWVSCVSNDHCEREGTWCEAGLSNRCHSCSSRIPLDIQTDPVTGDVYNYERDPRFVGFNTSHVLEVCSTPRQRTGMTGGGPPAVLQQFYPQQILSWCDRCVHQLSNTVEGTEQMKSLQDALRQMGPYDWVALCFATFIVALAIVNELKDIRLCQLGIQRAGDNLTLRWQTALSFLSWARRWIFLPSLLMSVPALVVFKGGDALSVCFNTVAIIFMCEIDNVCYAVGLQERVRARVEEAGRVDLNDTEATSLARGKAVHVATVMVFVIGSVLVRATSVPKLHTVSFFSPYLAFVAGGIDEAVTGGDSAGNVARRVAMMVQHAVLGFASSMVLFTVAFV